MQLSIIIPTLNEAESLPRTLENVMQLMPAAHEIILVDGGSTDTTVSIARQYPVKIRQTEKASRALQMNAGARAATGKHLCFLHADTLVPHDLVTIIHTTLSDQSIALAGFTSIMRSRQKIRWVASFHNYIKTYLLSFIYRPNLFFLKGLRLLFGDQVMFCRKNDFLRIGGFDEQRSIMEEADLCLRINKLGRVKQLRYRVESSDRRLAHWGFFKSHFIWTSICLLWVLGTSDHFLKRLYNDIH